MGGSRISRLVRRLAGREGNVSALVALMLIPLVGVFGMATESSSWFLIQRAAQNAADAAALAAASNNCAAADACHTTQLSATFADEAQAVAANYGFDPTVAANRTTVVALNNVACPSPLTTSDCYKVTITKLAPIYLLGIVGYTGDAAHPGFQNIVASAIASKPTPTDYCMVGLNKTGTSTTAAVTIKGAPNANLGGCSVYSNGSSDCDGQGANIGTSTTVDNVAANKACGTNPIKNAPVLADPFSSLASNIPASALTGCGGAFAGRTLTANLSSNTAATPYVSCGDLTVPAAGLTLTTASPGSVIIIEKGNLILKGNLTAAVGSGLTIIFSGPTGTPAGFVTNNGVLDFGAPASGTWSGMAMYQDPALTTPTTQTYSGNKPTFNITGVLYLPYDKLTISGAINHQTGGNACIGVVADTITIKGTGSFFANPTSQCYQSGVSLPGVPNSVSARQALVQ
jgi:Flp pilus assembly protein TadG